MLASLCDMSACAHDVCMKNAVLAHVCKNAKSQCMGGLLLGGMGWLVSWGGSGELRVQIRSRFAIFAMAECGSEASRAVLEPVVLARYGAGDAYR